MSQAHIAILKEVKTKLAMVQSSEFYEKFPDKYYSKYICDHIRFKEGEYISNPSKEQADIVQEIDKRINGHFSYITYLGHLYGCVYTFEEGQKERQNFLDVLIQFYSEKM